MSIDKLGKNMKQLFFVAAAGAALVLAAFGFQAQNRPQQDAPNADPYANNAAPGTTQFPLAAPAGKDSNAFNVAPPGAVNQGPFDIAKWKYGSMRNVDFSDSRFHSCLVLASCVE